MKTFTMCDQFDFDAFLKRRGLIVVVAMIVYVTIVALHLLTV
jgi:hypothetical protein